MTTVVLSRADLALFTDTTQRVVIPHLTAADPDRTYEGVTLRFDGDQYGTPFRGEGRGKTWPLAARYTTAPAEQAQLLALLNLLDLAAGSADSRLWLRTHYGQIDGLNEALAVVVFNAVPSPQMGGYTDVKFTAEAVDYTEAV